VDAVGWVRGRGQGDDEQNVELALGPKAVSALLLALKDVVRRGHPWIAAGDKALQNSQVLFVRAEQQSGWVVDQEGDKTPCLVVKLTEEMIDHFQVELTTEPGVHQWSAFRGFRLRVLPERAEKRGT